LNSDKLSPWGTRDYSLRSCSIGGEPGIIRFAHEPLGDQGLLASLVFPWWGANKLLRIPGCCAAFGFLFPWLTQASLVRPENKKPRTRCGEFLKACGEGGIRTLGTDLSPYNGLANRPFRPLRHLSSVCPDRDVFPKRATKIKRNYMAANWTFCCNSSTFSRKMPSVSIKSFTVWQEWITVVWSRPPKCSPIVFKEFLVNALARYMVI
jgi:hypothetical protein